MDLEAAVRKHSEMLYRICIVILGSEQDTQDAIQETFCKYLEKKPKFVDGEHEKAWLIKVATNHCRDIQRFRFRHPKVPIEELAGILVSRQEDREAVRELLQMPPKQRAVMVLHYVEGYQVKEIAGILGITEHAVKKRLQRGRDCDLVIFGGQGILGYDLGSASIKWKVPAGELPFSTEGYFPMATLPDGRALFLDRNYKWDEDDPTNMWVVAEGTKFHYVPAARQ